MLPSRSKSLSGQSSSSSSSGPKGPVLIEGMLEKKKTFGSSKFFCSLHDGKLWYSEDKGRESIIDISHAQSVREGKAKFSFEIITSSRTHTFVADSQPTRDKWVACLREVMRVSSRKNSTLSYIESANSDEETGGASSNPRSSSSSSVASSGQRSSGVKSPTMSPLKPGFVASLPVGLTTRGSTTTPLSSSSVAAPIKEERTHSSRTTTSEMTSLLESVSPSQTVESVKPKPSLECIVLEQEASKGGDGSRVMGGAQAAAAAAAYDGAGNEIKEDEDDRMHVTLSRDDGEHETKALSKDDVRESAALTRYVDSDENDSHNTVATEIVSMSPNSLYANNADIKKFLYEQSMEEEEEHHVDSVRASTSEETKCERKKSDDDSTSERQLQTDRKDRGAMSRGNTKEEEEEADDVFKCDQSERKDRNEEMKPPVAPVLRRASQPTVSMIVDSAQEEVEAASSSVELDVDFCRQPIPNLPHPHLDENWSLAFVEMRSILSSSDSIAKKENSAALTSTYIFKEQRQGCAVDSLKHFLKNIECG